MDDRLDVTHHSSAGQHMLLLHLNDDTCLWCTSCDNHTLDKVSALVTIMTPVILKKGDDTLFRYSEKEDSVEGYYASAVQAASNYCQMAFALGDQRWSPHPAESTEVTDVPPYEDGFESQDLQAMLLNKAALEGSPLPDEVSMMTVTLPSADLLIFHDFAYEQYLRARREYLTGPTEEKLGIRESAGGLYARLCKALEELALFGSEEQES